MTVFISGMARDTIIGALLCLPSLAGYAVAQPQDEKATPTQIGRDNLGKTDVDTKEKAVTKSVLGMWQSRTTLEDVVGYAFSLLEIYEINGNNAFRLMAFSGGERPVIGKTYADDGDLEFRWEMVLYASGHVDLAKGRLYPNPKDVVKDPQRKIPLGLPGNYELSVELGPRSDTLIFYEVVDGKVRRDSKTNFYRIPDLPGVKKDQKAAGNSGVQQTEKEK